MQQKKAEIIAIGTELLLGQIANTNAQWLSEQLALHGINTFYHTVVGDNPQRVQSVFQQAQKRSDIMIVSGGLGPTEDDMTREAFQAMSNIPLEEHEPSLKKMHEYFKNQQMEMTPNNQRQARVFTNAIVLENKVGMAPGMIVPYQGKTWVFLPGVPREMKQMARDDVFPYLMEKTDQQAIIQSMLLRFIGIGEAKLEYELKDMIENQTNPTIALLAQQNGLVIRLTVKETSQKAAKKRLEETKNKIVERVGSFMYGVNEEVIEKKIIEKLMDEKESLAAAESVTGGLFTDKLISVDGASAVCPGGIICYDQSIKETLLNIPTELIEKHGVISKQCALAMAKNITQKMNTNIGMGFTGVAGPKTIENKEVGTVYIAIYHRSGEQRVEKYTFLGDRNVIRNRAVLKGFEMLYQFLNFDFQS